MLPPTPRPPRLSRAGLIGALYLGLGLVALGVGAWRGHVNVFVVPGATGQLSTRHLAVGAGLGVAVGLLAVLMWRWAVHALEWARTLRREFRSVLGPLTGGEILLLAAASSIGEEMFFRGALLPALPAGLWLSSAVFALPHIGPSMRFVPWTISALATGLVFGAMFQATGDLLAPISAHFLINFLNLRHITERPL